MSVRLIRYARGIFPLRVRRNWVPSEAETSSRVPACSVNPAISGTGAVGQVLTASTGTWARARPNAFTYQWRRDGTPIAGATSSTYTVVLADSGTNLTVTVTGYNVLGAVSATSSNKAIS